MARSKLIQLIITWLYVNCDYQITRTEDDNLNFMGSSNKIAWGLAIEIDVKTTRSF